MGEYKLDFVLPDNGIFKQLSEKITGEIEAIIISSKDSLGMVTMNLENYPSVELLNIRNFRGEQYFPLRVRPVNEEGEGYNNAQTEYFLDDRINVTVMGVPGAEVKIRIRYKTVRL